MVESGAAEEARDVRVLASLTFALLEKGDVEAATKAIATLEKVDSNNDALPEFREKLASLKSGDKPK